MTQKHATLIGFTGDSGAGKSTYVRAISKLLGPERVTVIGLDDYHTLDRAQRKAAGITPLNPRCNDLGLLIDHAWQLKRRETIEKPVYDHATGTFTEPESVTPRDFVILEGLHALYLEMLRAALDLKIYFDTDLELKLRWKIKRDVTDRGHTVEQVKKEIDQRQPDILAFVEPQKRYADLIITLAPKEGSEEEIKVLLAERPAANSITSRVSQDTWRKRLGLQHRAQTLMGQHFEVMELSEKVSADTVSSLLAAIGGAEIPVNPAQYDPVSLSHILVCWRILNSRQQAGVLGSYAAQR